jgi:hypothetical protein
MHTHTQVSRENRRCGIPITDCVPCDPSRARVSPLQDLPIQQLHANHGCRASEERRCIRVAALFHRNCSGYIFFADVLRRTRCGERARGVYQGGRWATYPIRLDSSDVLLVHCDNDDSWVWRRGAIDTLGEAHSLCGHDLWHSHYCTAHYYPGAKLHGGMCVCVCERESVCVYV